MKIKFREFFSRGNVQKGIFLLLALAILLVVKEAHSGVGLEDNGYIQETTINHEV